ncbi:mercuric reductase [Longibacter salinarum]|uniref:Mercuric reductase n=1 Tax=Longibacter salinarum TaxID=1850348 RepID=A0A2A8D015_9BACT|nr:FAD-dependent oxidoreductase [Longibacter salinarum]PEN14183.1 mercuric reductase [Longibacter salinarum]
MASYDYDVLVIGGGAAGLSSAGIATNLGAKTTMIEREALGGDCTWTGCIPSKTLLKAAKVVHQARNASRFGLTDQRFEVDFAGVMEHVREVRQEVYDDADRPEIFEDMGIDVRSGTARFVDNHTVSVSGDDGSEQLTARFIVIAAGARAFVPPIDGLDRVPVLTNEDLFDLEEQPERLAIIGAGPIGSEMAQAFSRLGTDVTVLDMSDRILQNDDAQLADELRQVLVSEGVRYILDADITSIEQKKGVTSIHADAAGDAVDVEADAVLLATGRTANVEQLNLDAAGVNVSRKGITVDDYCRTSQRHIYAVGDVTGRYQFTHMSGHMAKVAVTNALLKVPSKIDAAHVPWVTYTDPELAHVGALPDDLDEQGVDYETYKFPFSKLDRAITEGETAGWIKVHAKSLTGTILGASVLGAHAGELISSLAVAMRNGVTLRNIGDTIHPYPAWGEGVKRVADQWYVQKQSSTFTRALKTVFGYRGPVIEPDPERII